MTDDKALTLKLDRARWWLLQTQPFYGQLAMRLRDVLVDSIALPDGTQMDTAGTDGERIAWCRSFLEKLSTEETRGVLLHETLHPAHQHMARLPHDVRGNLAGDYGINLIVEAVPGCALPPGCAIDHQYVGMAEEEILRRLPQASAQQMQQAVAAGGAFMPGSAKPGESESAAAQRLAEAWEGAVRQAALAVGHGNTPQAFDRVLAKLNARPVDWREELQEFVHSVVSDSRNDWSRPARRHAWQSVIYPRKRTRDAMALVVFARDTSGSVSDADCALFTAQIDAAIAATGATGLVFDADTDIQNGDGVRIDVATPCPLSASGYGGTDFRPVFQRVAELQEAGEEIAGVVYCTDMDGPFPDPAPSVATLWISTGTGSAPFGRVVCMRS